MDPLSEKALLGNWRYAFATNMRSPARVSGALAKERSSGATDTHTGSLIFVALESSNFTQDALQLKWLLVDCAFRRTREHPSAGGANRCRLDN
jgi:hypothetical protein